MDDSTVLQKISEDITDIKVTLAKQEVHLEEHIKRSTLLEEKVAILREEVAKSKGIKDFLVFIAKVSSLVGILLGLAKRFL